MKNNFILFFILAIVLIGCNAQKKLNKAAVKVAQNKEATGKFFDEYIKTNEIAAGKPVYVPGKEVVIDSLVIDTIYVPGEKTVIKERHYKDRLRVDSIYQDTKETLAIVKICQERNQTLSDLLSEKDTEIINWKRYYEEVKGSRNKWRLYFFLLLGSIIAIIVGKYYLKFSIPFLK